MNTRLFLFLCFMAVLPLRGFSQKKNVVVRITQDERAFSLDKYHTDVVLKKKGFKIQVLFSKVTGIYAFAGFTDSICCRLGEVDTMPHFSLLPDMTMREPEFNKSKELLIGEKDCSYWYYDKNLSSHPFNKKVINLDTNNLVCVKSIKQVYYVPERKEIKVRDLDRSLYLFFVAVDEFGPDGRPKKELMRRKVKIDWIEDDDD